MVFYLPKPPKEFTVVKDFRTLPAGVPRAFSPELLHAIRFAQERQAWAASYLKDEGIEPNTFGGSLKETANISREAVNFRKVIGLTVADQAECERADESWKLWRTRCESAGFYVFQASRVDVGEMRGAALPDPIFPIAIINAKDSPTARTFTLIHELAHILLGKAAVTGAGKDAFARAPVRRTERFCNQFAAEVLVPRSDFVARVPKNW